MRGRKSPSRRSAASTGKYLPGGHFLLALLIPPIIALLFLLLLLQCSLLFGRIAAQWASSMQSSAAFFAAKPLSSPAPPVRVRAVFTNPATEKMAAASGPKWAQKTITLPPQRRGCHLVTSKIIKEIGGDLSEFKCGLAHLFLHHTSASLTINENYDSDVRDDTETFLNKIVPEGRSAPWKHTLEGPDDMPAHIKSSMFGCSLTIPITNGKLNMGTWQGIWLCEHRDVATARTVVVTMNGI